MLICPNLFVDWSVAGNYWPGGSWYCNSNYSFPIIDHYRKEFLKVDNCTEWDHTHTRPSVTLSSDIISKHCFIVIIIGSAWAMNHFTVDKWQSLFLLTFFNRVTSHSQTFSTQVMVSAVCCLRFFSCGREFCDCRSVPLVGGSVLH